MRPWRWVTWFCGCFVLFVLLLTLYDVLVEHFPLRAMSAPADIHAKGVVDLVKERAMEERSWGLVTELLKTHEEITTQQIGKFAFSADEPSTDSWGTPLLIRVVGFNSESGAPEIGVYSKGPDCISNTQGNDADDISSWASVDNAFWRQVRRKSLIRRWIFRIELAAGITILSSALLWGYRRWRTMRQLSP